MGQLALPGPGWGRIDRFGGPRTPPALIGDLIRYGAGLGERKILETIKVQLGPKDHRKTATYREA